MDPFKDFPTTPTAPIRDAAAVTPSDTLDLAATSRALYVGEAGDLAVLTAGGQSVVFRNLAAGSLLPVRATRVPASGTTAGSLLALW